MRDVEDIRADWARLDELYATDKLDVMWNFARDIPDLLDELNTAQCAYAFVADSLSYETKRFCDALAEKNTEIERLQDEIDKTYEFHQWRERDAWQDARNAQTRIEALRRENEAAAARQYTTEEQRR